MGYRRPLQLILFFVFTLSFQTFSWGNLDSVRHPLLPAAHIAGEENSVDGGKLINLPGESSSYYGINFCNGVYTDQETDLYLPGKGYPIKIQRVYSTKLGLHFSCEMYFEEDQESGDITIVWETSKVKYKKLGQGIYETPRGQTLTKNPDGSITYIFENETLYQFSGVYQKIRYVVDGFGNQTIFNYSNTIIPGTYLLTDINDPGGRIVKIERDSKKGLLIGILFKSSKGDVHWRYNYNNAGNLTKATNPLGDFSTFTYDTVQRMTSQTDENGYSAYFTYDTKGRLLELKDSSGNTIISLEYRDIGTPPLPQTKKTFVTDAYSNKTSYFFDENDHLLGIKDALGYEVRQTWSGDALVKHTDKNGNVTTFTYGPDGLKLIKRPNGLWEAFFYKHPKKFQTHYVIIDQVENDTLVTRFEVNNQKLITLKEDANGGKTFYTYNIYGLLETETDANGNLTKYYYNNYGYPVQVRLPEGVRHYYTWDDMGNMLIYEDDNANETMYEYDLMGRMTLEEDALGYTTINEYDPAGNQVLNVNAESDSTKYEYNEFNLLTKETDAEGFQRIFEYDRMRNKIKEIGKNGDNIFLFEYDHRNLLKKLLFPNGCDEKFTYDGNENLLSYTNCGGNTFQYFYDAGNYLVKEIDPLGKEILKQVNSRGYIKREKDRDGNVTKYEYSRVAYDPLKKGAPSYRETRRIDALGGETLREYDSVGNLVRLINALGDTVQYFYNGFNNKTAMINEAGYAKRLTRDGEGNIVIMLNFNGYISTFAYDGVYNVVEIVDPIGIGNEIHFNYDGLGRRVKKTEPNGGVVEYEYDRVGNLVSIKDPLGGIETFTYDGEGNLLSLTDELGNTKSFEYAITPRYGIYPVTKIIDPLLHETHYQYDSLNRRKSKTDSNGNVTQYKYDKLDRLIRTVDAAGGNIDFSYNGRNNLTAYVDANSNTWIYEYDPLDRITSYSDPLGNVTSLTYDAIGNMITLTDPDLNVTHYEYNRQYLKTKITYPDGYQIDFLAYDPVGNLLEIVDSESAHEKFTYDRLNQLIGYRNETLGKSIEWKYNPMSGREWAKNSMGEYTAYQLDLNNRITSILTPDDASLGISYNEAGKVIEVTYPGGIRSSIEYNALKGVKAINYISCAFDTFDSYTYTYDNVENLVSVVESVNGIKEVVTLEYDELNRLVSENYSNHPSENTLYSYDAFSNRISMDRGGTHTTYAYDDASRLIQENDITYAYDSRGNLSQKYDPNNGATAYVCDNENRLTRIAYPDLTSHDFAYSAAGFRFKEIDRGNQVSYYLWDGSLISEVIDNSMQPVTQYIPAGYISGITAARDVSTKSTLCYLHDINVTNSVIGLSDEAGLLQGSYKYRAFGETREIAGIKASENPHRFTGSFWHDDDELYMYSNRNYDPTYGRFIAPNPALSVKSLANFVMPVRSFGVIHSPAEYMDVDIKRDLLSINKVHLNHKYLNGYLFEGNNPFAFTSPTGNLKLEKSADEEHPWKWHVVVFEE